MGEGVMKVDKLLQHYMQSLRDVIAQAIYLTGKSESCLRQQHPDLFKNLNEFTELHEKGAAFVLHALTQRPPDEMHADEANILHVVRGMIPVDAVNYISLNYPNRNVCVLNEDSCVTCDYHQDRVRLFVKDGVISDVTCG